MPLAPAKHPGAHDSLSWAWPNKGDATKSLGSQPRRFLRSMVDRLTFVKKKKANLKKLVKKVN